MIRLGLLVLLIVEFSESKNSSESETKEHRIQKNETRDSQPSSVLDEQDKKLAQHTYETKTETYREVP
jgi:hypothetical protein